MLKRVFAALFIVLAATSVFAASTPNVVPDNQSGLTAAVDPATGRLRQPTAAEVQALSKSFMATLNLHPLVPKIEANGTMSLVLDDSSAHFYMARLTEEGDVIFDCVNDPGAAISVLTTPATDSIMRLRPSAGLRPVFVEEK